MRKIWNDSNSEAKAEERAGSPTIAQACHCTHYMHTVKDLRYKKFTLCTDV